MDIYLFSPIFDDSAQDVADQIKQAGNEDINVHINSPGGNVFAGFAIYNLLKTAPNNIIVHIDGLAASIASVIAMAGDTIYMSESSQLMVHNSRFMFGGGSKEDLEKQIKTLEKIDNQLVNIYHARTGLAVEKIQELLSEESFLNANEALAFGFADSIVENKKIAAYFNHFNNMNKDDLLNGLKALNINLFGASEEDTKEIQEEADKIKEKTAEVVAKAEEERKAQLENADLLTADMVTHEQYKADFTYVQNAMKLFTDYIASQPTKDEIEGWIKDKINDDFKALLRDVKSKTEVPRPTNNFEEVVNDKDEKALEDWQYANEKLAELEKANSR